MSKLVQRGKPVATGPERPSPVRQDLWTAIMDYRSGRRYVWDDACGIARPVRADDTKPFFPTVTLDELARWRAEFVNSLDSADAQLARRWQRENLQTSVLPASLRTHWNRELTTRVRRLLQEFSVRSGTPSSPFTPSHRLRRLPSERWRPLTKSPRRETRGTSSPSANCS